MKKIIKQNLRFYSKFALLIGALIAFICSFGVSSYAWHEDINGNLASDNLVNYENASATTNGVTYSIQNGVITLNGTATGTVFIVANGTFATGTYTWAMFNSTINYNPNLSPLDNNIRIELRSGVGSVSTVSQLYFDTINKTKTFTISSNMSNVYIRIANGTTLNNFVFKPMLVSGTSIPTGFEPYGAIYYNYDVVEKASLGSYGCFRYANLIRVYYNNGTNTNLYKEFNNITDFTMESYVRMINNSIRIDDYTLIFTLLNGNSNWKWSLYITFPMGKVKTEDFQNWSLYGQVNFTIQSFTSGVNYSYNGIANPYNIDLLNQGFSNNDYISNITFERSNPNTGLPYGQLGTPNINSTYYNNGYNNGYDVGYSVGYDVGFDDSKSEHYDMGYNDGYRDGEESDFTTNGFKTLIGSIFNYPINMIRSIFNFEFMGINIFSIIVFVMSIGIVIFVIRRFKK